MARAVADWDFAGPSRIPDGGQTAFRRLQKPPLLAFCSREHGSPVSKESLGYRKSFGLGLFSEFIRSEAIKSAADATFLFFKLRIEPSEGWGLYY